MTTMHPYRLTRILLRVLGLWFVIAALAGLIDDLSWRWGPAGTRSGLLLPLTWGWAARFCAGLLLLIAPGPVVRFIAGRVLHPCPQCGHDLRGNRSGTCPECGHDVGPST